MFIPLFYAPRFVKKKEISDYLQRRKKMNALMVLGLGVIMGLIRLTVVPRMLGVYDSAGSELASWNLLLTQFMGLAAAFLVFLSLYIFMTPFKDEGLLIRFDSYEEEEDIPVGKLQNKKFDLILLSVLFIAILVILLSTVFPIYQLTLSV